MFKHAFSQNNSDLIETKRGENDYISHRNHFALVAVLIFGQRRSRWTNIKTALGSEKKITVKLKR